MFRGETLDGVNALGIQVVAQLHLKRFVLHMHQVQSSTTPT